MLSITFITILENMPQFPRKKPYTTNQENWASILNREFTVPMIQREYSWEKKEISQYANDIINIFEDGRFVERMGSLIVYKSDTSFTNEIYDGQQRILTTIVLLSVISSFSNKLKRKFESLLAMDDIDELTDEQKSIKEKYNAKFIPKINCVNPDDREALINIYNNISIAPLSCFIKNKEHIIYDEHETYTCICGTDCARKSDFERHCMRKHQYEKSTVDSKLNAAYEILHFYIEKQKYNEEKLVELWKFILLDIDIQYYECCDQEYASKIFEWENNRGRLVVCLDIMKNSIIQKIPDELRKEVYDRWEELKKAKNDIYKNFGEKLFSIAIRLYNKKLDDKSNDEYLFNTIINSEDTYAEIQKFFRIVEKLIDIMNAIKEDKFGRLLNHSKANYLNWEAYKFCQLPIFYVIGYVDKELLKLFSSWHFRNMGMKCRTFNSITYYSDFIRISNLVIENHNYDYLSELRKCLLKNQHLSISTPEDYMKTFQNTRFKPKSSKYMLLYLETYLNTDIHTVPLNYTLEHIYPQKYSEDLSEQTLMNNIGNLTLLEGTNSENGHSGNMSIGAESYKHKKKSYRGSNSFITRQIMVDHTNDTFDEKDIKIRACSIVKSLEEYTRYSS